MTNSLSLPGMWDFTIKLGKTWAKQNWFHWLLELGSK